MDDCDDDCGEDQVKKGIKEGDGCLPPLHGKRVDPGLWDRDLYIVIVPPHAFPETPLCVLGGGGVHWTRFAAGPLVVALHFRIQIVARSVARVDRLL